jgi:hypothetical protein
VPFFPPRIYDKTKADVALGNITNRYIYIYIYIYISKEDRKSHRAINVEVAAKLD